MGTFAASGVNVFSPDGSTIYFVSPSYYYGTVTIQAFNANRFTLKGSIQVPANGNVKHLITWGTNGLAFNTDQGQVVVAQVSFAK